MALYPWSNGFETGAHGATSSSGTLIDFPHYTELARQGMAPFRGSYCLRVRLAGGTDSQYVQEDTAYDVVDANETWYTGFYFYLGKDLVLGSADKLSFVQLNSGAVEVEAGIIVASGVISFWYNETAAAASPSTIVLGTTTTALGKWYHAELATLIDPGANDGTIIGYINGTAGATVGSLDQGDIVDAKFGTLGVDTGTSGTILLDDIILDSARIYPVNNRFTLNNKRIYHLNDHPIVGAACFSIALTGTGTDAVLRMYDSDGVPTNLDNTIGPPIRNVSANEMVPGHDVFECKYGLYTIMSGTAPEASVSIERGGVISQGDYIVRGHANKHPLPRQGIY